LYVVVNLVKAVAFGPKIITSDRRLSGLDRR